MTGAEAFTTKSTRHTNKAMGMVEWHAMSEAEWARKKDLSKLDNRYLFNSVTSKGDRSY